MEPGRVGPSFRGIWRRLKGVEILFPPGKEGYGPDEDGMGVDPGVVSVYLRVLDDVLWSVLLPELCHLYALPWASGAAWMEVAKRFYQNERGELCYTWVLRGGFPVEGEEADFAVLEAAVRAAAEYAATLPRQDPEPAAAPRSQGGRPGLLEVLSGSVQVALVPSSEEEAQMSGRLPTERNAPPLRHARQAEQETRASSGRTGGRERSIARPGPMPGTFLFQMSRGMSNAPSWQVSEVQALGVVNTMPSPPTVNKTFTGGIPA